MTSESRKTLAPRIRACEDKGLPSGKGFKVRYFLVTNGPSTATGLYFPKGLVEPVSPVLKIAPLWFPRTENRALPNPPVLKLVPLPPVPVSTPRTQFFSLTYSIFQPHVLNFPASRTQFSSLPNSPVLKIASLWFPRTENRAFPNPPVLKLVPQPPVPVQLVRFCSASAEHKSANATGATLPQNRAGT